jgi:threonine/homoserine/homoserine lactone efflux protein
MPQWAMIVMIAMVMAGAAQLYSLASLFMFSRQVIVRLENARRWIERTAGIRFNGIGIGGKILADSSNPVAP